jgi:hypothetical protein
MEKSLLLLEIYNDVDSQTSSIHHHYFPVPHFSNLLHIVDFKPNQNSNVPQSLHHGKIWAVVGNLIFLKI